VAAAWPGHLQTGPCTAPADCEAGALRKQPRSASPPSRQHYRVPLAALTLPHAAAPSAQRETHTFHAGLDLTMVSGKSTSPVGRARLAGEGRHEFVAWRQRSASRGAGSRWPRPSAGTVICPIVGALTFAPFLGRGQRTRLPVAESRLTTTGLRTLRGICPARRALEPGRPRKHALFFSKRGPMGAKSKQTREATEKQMWVVDDGEQVFELMYGGSRPGRYHGYPIRLRDPWSEEVKRIWRERRRVGS